jgi:flavodoxin
MRSLLICVSVSNGSTRRLADAMADELGTNVVEPEQVDPGELGSYDLVGFGSGIYAMSFHHRLVRLVHDVPRGHGTNAFLFATRGAPQLTTWLYMPAMSRLLRSRGFDVRGRFSCAGLDTSLPIPNGTNRGRPNADDLAAARTFAAGLAREYLPVPASA